jgi:hypothetical protein
MQKNVVLTKVYYFPINNLGEEVGEPVPVVLQADGSVDVSLLPREERETLESMGAPDSDHRTMLFPKDGSEFLEGLLRLTNGYRRYRSQRV